MPVPRLGRKGGKVSTGEARSTQETPTEGQKDLSKPTEKAENVAESAASVKNAAEEKLSSPELEEGGKEPPAPKKVLSAWSEGVVQIDKDAALQVGRGTVVRGLKAAQTKTRSPEATAVKVSGKLEGMLKKQKASVNGSSLLPSCLKVVANNDVALIPASAGIFCPTALLREVDLSKVLVVVPTYSSVNEVAELLRSKGVNGKSLEVGELVGACASGSKSFRLWVTDAETAHLYLFKNTTFAPFSHIVFPELVRISPMESMLFFAIRSFFANDASKCAKVVIGTNTLYSERLSKYFASESIRVASTVKLSLDGLTVFSYDEACALAKMEVLELVGALAQRPPEQKAVAHCAAAAAKVVEKVVSASVISQNIFIFTCDPHGVLSILRMMNLKETVLNPKITTSKPVVKTSPSLAKKEKHKIFVLSEMRPPSATGGVAPTLVIDLGTICSRTQPSRANGFLGGFAKSWTSTDRLQEHQNLVGAGGGYFSLYPELSDIRLPTSEQCGLEETERALLVAARTNIPLDGPLVVPLPQDLVENATSHFSDSCFISSSFQLNFVGEMAARLPLVSDLSLFVVQASALGFGELAIVVAAVFTLSMRSFSDSLEEVEKNETLVHASRQKYAPILCNTSDVMADAAVYLEWLGLMLKKEKSAKVGFPEEIGTSLTQLNSIRKFIHHLCIQLSDYLFLDSFDDVDSVDHLKSSLFSNATFLSLIYGVSLDRYAACLSDVTCSNSGTIESTFCFVRPLNKLNVAVASSNVTWCSSNFIVAADVTDSNGGRQVKGSRITALAPDFFKTSLLLLSPTAVNSASFVESGGVDVVIFGVLCNGHRKRYRVPVEHAKRILSFRDKCSLALGVLEATSLLARPLDQCSLNAAIREEIAGFDLESFQASLRTEFFRLLMDVDLFDHNSELVPLHMHYFLPKTLVTKEKGEPSDLFLLKVFESCKKLPDPVILRRGCMPGTEKGYWKKDDDVEDDADLYFYHDAPIDDREV